MVFLLILIIVVYIFWKNENSIPLSSKEKEEEEEKTQKSKKICSHILFDTCGTFDTLSCIDKAQRTKRRLKMA